MYARPLQILLVEDNPGDIDLTREALADGKIYHELHVTTDGVEAMAFLRQQAPFNAAPRPDLILLDLNLPRKDGREVLQDIKSDDELKSIPVVVLTTSSAEQDILSSYDLQANCFISKPVGLNEFLSIVQQISDFWLTIVRLPSR